MIIQRELEFIAVPISFLLFLLAVRYYYKDRPRAYMKSLELLASDKIMLLFLIVGFVSIGLWAIEWISLMDTIILWAPYFLSCSTYLFLSTRARATKEEK